MENNLEPTSFRPFVWGQDVFTVVKVSSHLAIQNDRNGVIYTLHPPASGPTATRVGMVARNWKGLATTPFQSCRFFVEGKRLRCFVLRVAIDYAKRRKESSRNAAAG